MALLSRKKGRKLLPLLLELQQDDVDITAPTLIALKFYLRSRSRCNHVEIKPSGEDVVLGLIGRRDVPNFILSQLEIQGIANEKDDFLQLHPVLSFILLSLPSRPAKGSSYPTVFRWHCSRLHRTRVLFVYLDISMPSQSYTPDQLLALRGAGTLDGILAVAQKHPDLTTIITAPRERPQVMAAPPTTSAARQARRSTKDDSSTDSDELLYKGQRDRQFPQGDTTWKLREREDTEAATTSGQSQPQPAGVPVGPSTQHNEGFQRFYKAVVSPTHVRVTAGGRIVPNTRGPPSPTMRRPKDKSTLDLSTNDGSPTQAHATPVTTESNTAPASKTAAPGQAQMPLFPGVFANFPPQFMPMPMMGVNVPFGAFQFPPPGTSKGVSSPQPHGDPQEAQNKKGDMDSHIQPSASQKTEGSAPKLSPIEQLDLTKPYILNGQMFFPVPGGALTQPMGLPFMPAGMIPPGFGPVPSAMMPPGMPMSPMFPAMGFPGAPGMMQNMASVAAASNNQPQQPRSAPVKFEPPSAPPISSIRPSDISKKQIETLKGTLKYHEDQLHFNKHQVDEKEMDRTIKMLRAEIKRFEDLRRGQLEDESQRYPKRESSSECTDATTASTSLPLQPHSSHMSLPGQQKVAAALENARRSSTLRKKESNRFRSAQIGSQSHKASSLFDYDEDKETLGKTCLPSAAALAPPFEPRSGSSLSQSCQSSFGHFAPSDFTEESRKISEQRLLSAGARPWDSFEGSINSRSTLKGKAPTSKGPGKKADGGSVGTQRFELPYLIGTLPPGMDPRTAHDTDYRYPRALTDDEIRARYLYWGKAPEEVRRGLPKYDGRNFYKASIIQDSEDLSPVHSRSVSVQRDASASADSIQSFHMPAGARDPFQPSTPTEKPQHLHHDSSPVSMNPAAMPQHFGFGMNEVDAHESRLQGASASAAKLADEERASEQLDRRSSERSGGVRLLQSMLKRGVNRSNEALPGAVTSTNAHGYVPPCNYSTFSMAPPIMGPIGQGPTGSPALSSSSRTLEAAMVTPTIDKRMEHNPSVGAASLEEQFRRIVSAENKQRASSSIPMNGRLPDDW